MCVMEGVTILMFKRWSMKEGFVKESAGDEAFSMTAMAKLCLMESG